MSSGQAGSEPAPVLNRLNPIEQTPDGVADQGPVRNTLLQFASQLSTLVLTGVLTLYLVRALGPTRYGVYALALSISGLVVFPAGLGLPLAIGRFLADHRGSFEQLREIFRLGMKLQAPAALLAGIGLFAASGALADAYGKPDLGWPLRWAALSVFGQALFAFLSTVGSSVRRSSLVLWMTVIESAVETCGSIVLVVVGAGAAGAAFGRFAGYSVSTVAGVYLALRLIGRRRAGVRPQRRVSTRSLLSYAGAMFVVDVTWSAITQLDLVLIGALLTTAAVGSFAAVTRIMTVLGYLGMAVSAGVAPRLSLADGKPDIRSFEQGMRYLIVAQGLVIAPLTVWAKPVVDLLLGSQYHQAAAVMRALTFYYFIGAPASLITVTMTYLGEARRRMLLIIPTFVLGLVAVYVLLQAIGLLGAALGDDIMEAVYVGGNLWICRRLIDFDLIGLAWSTLRTVLAAAAMGIVLFLIGTQHLSVAQWIGGGFAGTVAFVLSLIALGEVSSEEIAAVAGRLRSALKRG